MKTEFLLTYEQWERINKRRRKKALKKIYNKIMEYLTYSIMVFSPVLLFIIWLIFGY